MGRSHILDLFTQTLFDAWAEHTLQSVRWARAKTVTQERWLECVASAVKRAQAGRFGAGGELRAGAPDPAQALALEVSSMVDAARSRATTRAGVRRARKASGEALYTFWVPAVKYALAIVQDWTSTQLPGQLQAARDALASPQLLLPPPAADRPLSLDEAPY
ncbi:hypothetical protein [Caulobacter sp. S45]|uniref:hypothetical protein n=1 Tax=Caulobacter sp. S45 TaxID=1641861 RepID=UPI001577164B|nr:hypothetical protein [Caulobacter sp. S45]